MLKAIKGFIRFTCLILLFFSCKNSNDESDAYFTFGILSLTHPVDLDLDGYYRQVNLNIDINVDTEDSKNLYIRLYYKQSSAADNYTLYKITDNFNISSGTAEDIIAIELNGDSIPNGTFDFKIEVYEPSTSPYSPKITATTGFALERVKLEPPNMDKTPVSIYQIFWSDSVDNDFDNYISSANLNIDVDVITGISTVKVNVYYKLSSEKDFMLYGTIPAFLIDGQMRNDVKFMQIGNSIELPNGVYNFKVDVLNSGNYVLISATTNNNLSNQLFESAAEDN